MKTPEEKKHELDLRYCVWLGYGRKTVTVNDAK